MNKTYWERERECASLRLCYNISKLRATNRPFCATSDGAFVTAARLGRYSGGALDGAATGPVGAGAGAGVAKPRTSISRSIACIFWFISTSSFLARAVISCAV